VEPNPNLRKNDSAQRGEEQWSVWYRCCLLGRRQSFAWERLRRSRGGQGPARSECSGATACHEGALEETPPLMIEALKQFLSMKFKFWARLIITCAHDGLPLSDEPFL
jgi:hypothetical protein